MDENFHNPTTMQYSAPLPDQTALSLAKPKHPRTPALLIPMPRTGLPELEELRAQFDQRTSSTTVEATIQWIHGAT
ncbi:hypothetical protein GU926_06140 [Nibribacter ruber]|uniref:Uncharacterized protein n=1 Tax=Nibribacter ruber TaxID=2698458 RepID=A0A6P1NTJ1_9BACT|nr:hypothetical protein [Nibribacter ruber]QHL87037.1 hypothetical protein GU926_06140 [Nibribacter ruber]